MKEPDISVASRPALRLVADIMARAGAPQAPLYTAAAEGRIAVVLAAAPNTPWPTTTMARLTRPTVLILSGDPGWGEPTFGPERWRCARKARSWAKAAIVHGTAGKPEHYRDAVTTAALVGHLVLVETTSALVAAWGTFLAPLPRIAYLPPDGGVHPVPPAVLH